MIEVLVTVVILTFGLLGLAGLQARLQSSEIEAYQRSQGLLLLNDMGNKINANRTVAASYVTATPLGAGTASCTPDITASRQVQDSCDWHNTLLGAAEQTQTNSNVGAMVAARGCVEDLGNNQYMITVAWQGLGAISAPPNSVACGKDLYDGAAGSACTDDKCRRTLTTTVRMAVL